MFPRSALLIFFSAFLIVSCATLNAETKDTKDTIFIITDILGVKTRVKNLKIFKVEGSRSYFADSFLVHKGEALIKVKLNELAGVQNDWVKKDVKLYFCNGKILECKIIDKLDIHYITGLAVIGDIEVPYKLKREDVFSAFREGFNPSDAKDKKHTIKGK
jgi:hypothetical protein